MLLENRRFVFFSNGLEKWKSTPLRSAICEEQPLSGARVFYAPFNVSYPLFSLQRRQRPLCSELLLVSPSSSPLLSSSSSAALNSCLSPRRRARLRLRSLSQRSANVPLCRRGIFSSPSQTIALRPCFRRSRTVARSSSSASSLRESLPEASPSRTDPLPSSPSVQAHSVTAVPPSCLQVQSKRMKKPIVALLMVIFFFAFNCFNAEEAFDVRKHLSTVSRYGAVKEIANGNFIPSKVPEGCVPTHLNLVARHGTRSPTKKRIRELDNLSLRLEDLIKDARGRNLHLERVPSWLDGWKSPWQGRLKGGELVSKGEEELYDLGLKIREKFPSLFDEEYHPNIYTIRATQVPRASASAVAFGMGLYSGNGSLGPGKHRAFSVISESRASDIMLRFHDCCHNYKHFREKQEPAVNKLKEPVLNEITSALIGRYGLNFTRQDISSLWFLCKQEASLLDITNQACSLFGPSEIMLLEWTDDLEAYILKGYGNSLNYRMGLPLLEDVVQSMEQAIQAEEERRPPGSFEKARLRFAHAETIIPFSCLLGLFLDGSEFTKIQKEQPLQLPPKPPQKRTWRGSTLAPFAGNNMLILYSCPAQDKSKSKHFVQVLHNEHPIPMPGCDGSDFCSFEVFKEKIVAPHQKHDYDTVCNPKQEPSSGSIYQMFQWLFSLSKGDKRPRDEF